MINSWRVLCLPWLHPNKAESYHGFAQWLSFGNNGVLADNDPAEQEKLIKLNTLLANLVIFHNALDIMDVVRGLVAEGWTVTADQLAALSPYLRGHITRFGAYATDELGRHPGAFNPVLKEVDFTNTSYLIVHPRGTLMMDSGAMPDSEFKGDGAPVTWLHRVG